MRCGAPFGSPVFAQAGASPNTGALYADSLGDPGGYMASRDIPVTSAQPSDVLNADSPEDQKMPTRGKLAPSPLGRSQQSQAPEARMPLAADHEVIVDRDAERFGRLADLLRHLDVLARGLGIARGVVVHLAFRSSNDLILLRK